MRSSVCMMLLRLEQSHMPVSRSDSDIHIHTYMDTYTYTYARTCTYTYIHTCKYMPTLCKKMHMDSCMRAYSTVQQLLCHGGCCELILSLARLLFTARPTARSLAALRDVVRSRNPSKSTLTPVTEMHFRHFSRE